MLKTIRAKVLFTVFFILFLLVMILFTFSFFSFQRTKKLLLDSFSRYTQVNAESINKEVLGLEDNAFDLAAFGEVYFKTKRNRDSLEKFLLKVFENYEESLGGGIWFEPYALDKNKRLASMYAFRNKQNKIVIDPQYETEEYNYLERSWYKEITQQLRNGAKIAWSFPYYEKEGGNTLMVSAGAGIYDNGELKGISTVDWEITTILKSVSKIKPTPNSFSLFADKDKDYILITTDKYLNNSELLGKSIKSIPWYNENLINLTYFKYHNTKYVPYVKDLNNGMILIVCIPKWELFGILVAHNIGVFAILIAFFFLIFSALYIGLRKYILNPIDKLSEMAKKIGQGDSHSHIVIEKPEEFARLANTFDKMTTDIKTITKKQVRLENELSIAKSIQASSLPSVFPPFPERKEFDIFASMTPAKEVGGDFYDFYFTSPETIMFLIADVSGKGIPAALFMMRVKTLISNVSQTSCRPEELFDAINKEICQNNREGLFVTMYACIVNIYTGDLYCINCGHNPPLIMINGNNYRYLHTDSNIVLGAFPHAKYNIFKTKINAGDRIFLYTDGITEAINQNEELYGEERLLSCINSAKDKTLNETVEIIKSSVTDFSDNTEQSDDITMLIFEYHGDIKTYKDEAVIENYKNFLSWLLSLAQEWNFSDTMLNKIEICAEEIYTNIAFYAYPNASGMIEVNVNKADNTVIMQFVDEGISYNPLEKPDPDITLNPKDRPIGGLGIFMVKQMSTKITYERSENKNILTIILED